MADNKLQALAGDAAKPAYQDIAFARGVTAHRPYAGGDVHPSTAWHAQFADVNNDGRPDLFVVKGNIGQMPDFAMLDPSNLLLGTPEGRFVEAGRRGRPAQLPARPRRLLVDLNGDGLLDAIIVNRWDRARLWRNVGAGTAQAPTPMGHWLAGAVAPGGGNRHAVGPAGGGGAGRVQQIEQVVGGGHASGTLGTLHVGLGDAARHACACAGPATAGAATRVSARGSRSMPTAW